MKQKEYLLAEGIEVIKGWVLVCLFVITRCPLGMVVLKNRIPNRNLLGLIERSKRL